MTETAQGSTAATPAASKVKSKVKKSVGAAKPKKASPSHPPTSQMVNTAIENLKARGGSSLAAIKKYICTAYKVDAERFAPHIRRYVISAVESGVLIRTKGVGAAGSFKLSPETVKEAKKLKAEATKNANKPLKTAAASKKVVSSKRTTPTSKASKPEEAKPAKRTASKAPMKKVAKATSPAKKQAPKKAVPKKTVAKRNSTKK